MNPDEFTQFLTRKPFEKFIRWFLAVGLGVNAIVAVLLAYGVIKVPRRPDMRAAVVTTGSTGGAPEIPFRSSTEPRKDGQ